MGFLLHVYIESGPRYGDMIKQRNSYTPYHSNILTEVILPPKILPADLAEVLFREVFGVNCGKTAISRCEDVWGDPPFTDGSPAGKLCSGCTSPNYNPHC